MNGAPAMQRQDMLLALLMLIVLGTLRGGAVSISRYVSVAGVPPFGYVFWQSTCAALALLALSALRGKPLATGRVYARYYLVCAMLGIVLPNGVFFLVVRHITAGSMAIVLTTVPLLTYVYALALRMERLNGLRAAGIATGFAGAAIMAWPAPQTSGFNGYLLLAFLCPACYALASVYASRARLPATDPTLLACGTMLTASLCSLPLALTLDQFHPLWQLGPVDWLIVVHGALAAIAFTLFFNLVRLAGPVFYSQSTYIIGITGIGWGMLIFDESHGSGFWLATLLVLGGIALVNRQQRAAVPPA